MFHFKNSLLVGRIPLKKWIKRILFLVFLCFITVFLIFFTWERSIESYLTTHSQSITNSGCVLTLWHDSNMGLGNLMFVYASLYGISKKLNLPAVVATKRHFPLYTFFENQLKLPYLRLMPFRSPYSNFVLDDRCCVYAFWNVRLLNGTCRSPVRLESYLQSWKYFHEYREEILDQFRCPKNDRLEKILNGENDGRKIIHRNDYFLIGVHARRGDMVENKKLIGLGYMHATKSFLINAMGIMKKKLMEKYPESKKRAIFLLFGNDYDWNLKNFRNFSDMILVKASESAFDDFCLLTGLEHTIFSVGTFGWWVGYMTNGIVIYDQKFAREGSWFETQFVKDDFLLTEWIGVTGDKNDEN